MPRNLCLLTYITHSAIGPDITGETTPVVFSPNELQSPIFTKMTHYGVIMVAAQQLSPYCTFIEYIQPTVVMKDTLSIKCSRCWLSWRLALRSLLKGFVLLNCEMISKLQHSNNFNKRILRLSIGSITIGETPNEYMWDKLFATNRPGDIKWLLTTITHQMSRFSACAGHSSSSEKWFTH